MLTVQGLAREMGLEIVAGTGGAGAQIRWIHATELPDPTPWLSGGELLLTTGIQISSEDEQREFVRRLAEGGLAGLGFGTGLAHDETPSALTDEADRLDFPVFEVPYDVPFIAITEKAFTRLVNEQYEMLQRGIAHHRRLERLLLEEKGLDEIVRALSGTIGGAVIVTDPRGAPLSTRIFRRELPEGALEGIAKQVAERTGPLAPPPAAVVPEQPELAGRALALPVITGTRRTPEAWLVAVRDEGGLGDFERLLLQQAVTVVALELMRQRAMRDTERRLAGDVLAEALNGGLDSHELEGRLRPFGIAHEAAALVFSVEDPESAETALAKILQFAGVPGLVASRDGILCAIVDASAGDPLDTAEQARAALADELGGDVRAAASRPADAGSLRRSFHEARCALEASSIAASNGDVPLVASYRDLGAYQLLLSLQDDDALRLYCDSVLGPLENGEGEYGDELLRSLEAFIEQNGQWERAARQLYCHRHTLRYRIRRIEQLTGRDLGRAQDRIEFWLALRARELVR
jgi:PucR family transcriptional regulator, purine catabolism regulatory protein